MRIPSIPNLLRIRRHACVRAAAAADCGPACVATVAAECGVVLSLAQARELADGGLYGAEMGGLRDALKAVGIAAAVVRLPHKEVSGMSLPAILHLDDTRHGHFVTLCALRGSYAIVADPSKGLRKLSVGELVGRWSGHAVVCAGVKVEATAPGSAASPLRQLLLLSWSERRALWASVALATVVTMCGLGGAAMLRSLVNRLAPSGQLQTPLLFVGGMAILLAVRGGAAAARSRIAAVVGMRVERVLATNYVASVFAPPLRVLEKRFSGDLYARLVETHAVQQAAIGATFMFAADAVMLLVTCVLLARENPVLTAITLTATPGVVFVSAMYLRRQEAADVQVREKFSQLASGFMEVFGNIKVIKAYGAEDFCVEQVGRAHAELLTQRRKSELLFAYSSTWSSAVGSAFGLIVLMAGSLQAAQGGATLGDLAFYYAVFGVALSSAAQLTPELRILREGMNSWRRLQDVAERTALTVSPQPFRPTGGPGPYELENVSFTYQRSGRHVLRDLSLRINAGETVALVGATGSGKSTLAAILAGLYVPSYGSIRLGGAELADVAPGLMKSGSATIVFQEPGLMSGTVRENIVLGAKHTSSDAIRRATVAACADEFVIRLAKDYDTEIGPKGALLSSGQRQRLALARALLREPDILILDEATCSLDPRTERAVLANIMGGRSGRTTVVITHRLQTLIDFPRILVLKDGALVESGRHEDLLSCGGEYASLWNASLGEARDLPAPRPAGMLVVGQ